MIVNKSPKGVIVRVVVAITTVGSIISIDNLFWSYFTYDIFKIECLILYWESPIVEMHKGI